MGMDHEQWIQMYANMSAWDIEIEAYNDPGLEQLHADQKKECNREFNKFIEKYYQSWLHGDGPVLSHKVLDHFVTPQQDYI